MSTELEDRLRRQLAELAEATPIRPRAVAEELDDYRAETHHRPSRLPWLLAAAAAVLAVLVAVPLLVGDDSRSLIDPSSTDVPAVDTGALGDGHLAFVIENDLFTADGATGQVHRITRTGKGEEVSYVSWSHDGEWVAFAIHDENGLWVARPDGSDAHRIGRSPSSYAWSPTADELVYATADEVRLAQVDGTSVALDTPAPVPFTSVVWSPDGSQLAYAAADGSLVVASSAGVRATDWLTDGGSHVSRALVWPRDRMLLIAEQVGDGDPQLVAVDRAALQVLASLSAGAQATASRDGRWISIGGGTTGPGYLCTTVRLACGMGPEPGADAAFSPDSSLLASFVGQDPGSERLQVVDLTTDSTYLTAQVAPRSVLGGSYGVVPEPPVWIDDRSLIVRDGDQIVRHDLVESGPTTIVSDARYKPPADDYPGGVGLAYWSPGA